jgi:putative sterol carrier protein
MSLATATEQLQGHLPQLAQLGYKVKFAIQDEGVILIDASDTPVTLSHDDAEADCTIRLTEERLAQLIDGRLSPTLAYTLGQIKVEGSLGVAMKLASLLEG